MNRGVFGCAATSLAMFVSLGAETTEAAETPATHASGFYVGVAANRVEHEATGEGGMLASVSGIGFGFVVLLTPDQVERDEIQTGWNVTLGYRINKYLAAELAYYDFGEASVVERYQPNLFPLPSEISVRSNIEAYGPGVSLLGTLPLSPAVDLFARGGVLFLDQEISRQIQTSRITHRTGDEIWMAGAGAQWSFAPRWTARLEYQLTDDIESDPRTLTNQGGTTKIEQASLSVLFDF